MNKSKFVLLLAAVFMSSLLVAPVQASVQGNGFTEQILSCTGESSTVLRVNQYRVVMLRAAPECTPIDPIVFVVKKDRKWFSVMTTRTSEVFEHRIKIEVK